MTETSPVYTPDARSLRLGMTVAVLLGGFGYYRLHTTWPCALALAGIALFFVRLLSLAPFTEPFLGHRLRRISIEVGSVSTALLYSLSFVFAVASGDPVVEAAYFLHLNSYLIMIGNAFSACGFEVSYQGWRAGRLPSDKAATLLLPSVVAFLAALAFGDLWYVLMTCVYGVGVHDLIGILAHQMRELAEARALAAARNAELAALTTTDALTGALNRRAFEAALAEETAALVRGGPALSLILIDIDHFKAMNDVNGHQAGDECLRDVAITMRQVARAAGSSLARFGGEEFAVLLPGQDESAAAGLALALGDSVRARALPHPTSPHGVVTVSLGHVTLRAEDEQPDAIRGTLVARADAALYAAKRGGRDRAVGWHPRFAASGAPSPRSPDPLPFATDVAA